MASKDRGIEWLGGLIEGEGSFTLNRAAQKNGRAEKVYLHFRVTMSSNDEDVIDEVVRIAGGSKSYAHGPKAQERGIKPRWDWSLGGKAAEELAWKLAPYLLSRRRMRFLELIQEAREAKARGWLVESVDTQPDNPL